MLELLAWAALGGLGIKSAAELKAALKRELRKGNAKKTSDFKKRKAAARKRRR